MYLSEVEQYCLNSLTPQRSTVQKCRPRRTGELASMSASATAAALGAVERLLDSRLRYFTAINNLTSIQSLRLPVHVVVANVPIQLHTENMHECLQLFRLAAAIGMQALT
jgi:hypothetical protein